MKRVASFLLVCVGLLAFGQPASWSLDQTQNLPKPAKSSPFKHYPVFFVTDRQQKSADSTEFTSERAAQLKYGFVTPAAQPTSSEKLERADVHLFDARQTFMTELKKTGAHRVAVFIHGYRKGFDGSVNFAQRMAQQLDVPVVLFAWPSKNKYSAYMIDECTAEWSSFELAHLLKDLGGQFGNENVEIISHSLGARMVTWAFRDLSSSRELDRPFGSALFFSPDMDRDVLVAEGPFIKRCSSTVRFYLDRHDSRIWLSKLLHGSPRVGTMDASIVNSKLLDGYNFDTSLPSHQIPFDVLSASVSRVESARALPDAVTAKR